MAIVFVPACDILPVDTLEGTRTLMRLQAALAVWNAVDDIFVVSGGVYLPHTRQVTPAAYLMARWLVQQGVPVEKIIPEAQSRDTFENVSLSLSVLRERLGSSYSRNTSIKVVSEPHHVKRIRFTLRNAHAWKGEIVSVDADYQISPAERLMETIFYWIHLHDVYGDGRFARWNRKRRTY